MSDETTIQGLAETTRPTAIADGASVKIWLNEYGAQVVSAEQRGISISQTPTVTAGAYAAKDAVGGLLTFASAAKHTGGGGVIKDVLILDDAGQDDETELWLFSETFTAMTDNAAWDPSQADLRNLVGIISTASGAWFDAGTESAARVECSQRYDLTGTSMFGQLVTRGTPTYAATDDVTVIIGLLLGLTMLGTRRSILGAGEYRSSDVPQSEADALIAFYNATGGSAWTHKQGWLIDPVVGNWYGVTVAGGHVTEISLNNNNLVGAAGSTLDPIAASLTELQVHTNSLTTLDVSSLTALLELWCVTNTGLSVLDVSALTSLTKLYCYSCDISILDVSSLTNLTILSCYQNSISTLNVTNLTSLVILSANANTLSVLDIAGLTALSDVRCKDNAMTEAEVDQIVQDIYDNWAAYTDATPALQIHGTNAAPSGTYQDGDPPTTGKEYIYEIVNDPETTGNEKWAVSYTA